MKRERNGGITEKKCFEMSSRTMRIRKLLTFFVVTNFVLINAQYNGGRRLIGIHPEIRGNSDYIDYRKHSPASGKDIFGD